jgi:vacuolar protein sorting-associated protein 35
MNRLSAYAAREADAVTPEQRQKNEEEATQKLLEQLQISRDAERTEHEQNGDSSEAESQATTAVESEASVGSTSDDDTGKRVRGIPDDIKLFEIFNEQVQSLVKLQRLPLWDSVALMVALTNLAL